MEVGESYQWVDDNRRIIWVTLVRYWNEFQCWTVENEDTGEQYEGIPSNKLF